MRVDSISISNYRCFDSERKIEIPSEGRGIVVYGPAASGKTALADAVAALMNVYSSVVSTVPFKRLKDSDLAEKHEPPENPEQLEAPGEYLEISGRVVFNEGLKCFVSRTKGADAPAQEISELRSIAKHILARSAYGVPVPPFIYLRQDRAIPSRFGAALKNDRLSFSQLAMADLIATISASMLEQNPACQDPTAIPALIVIDDFDAHLAPGQKSELLEQLLDLFPASQFILTTSDPNLEPATNLIKITI